MNTNYQLEESTELFSKITRITAYYALFSIALIFGGFILFKGAFAIPDIKRNFSLIVLAFPTCLATTIVLLSVMFTKIDRMAVGGGKRTQAERDVYSTMGCYKVVMALIALFVFYKSATMHFFGVGFFSFAPEYHFLFESAYNNNAMTEATHAFWFANHATTYIGLYSFLAVYFVGGALGYLGLMRSAQAVRQNAYYRSLRNA